MATIKIKISSQEDLVKQININKGSSSKSNITLNFYLTQADLKQLAQSNLGIQMEELSISPEYSSVNWLGENPIVDFSEVSFPNLKSLSTFYQAMKAVDFTKERTPILRSLGIHQPFNQIEKFHMDLPELEWMDVAHITCAVSRGFGKSLSRSPQLTTFSAYKLYGLHVPKSKTHVLVLPNCERLSLYRSDDLNYLKIWAPKLEDLNLQSCVSITEVSIMDSKPDGREYTGPEYSFSGTPSQYKVNLFNVNKPTGNLTTHQRCKKVLDKIDELFGDSDTGDEGEGERVVWAGENWARITYGEKDEDDDEDEDNEATRVRNMSLRNMIMKN